VFQPKVPTTESTILQAASPVVSASPVKPSGSGREADRVLEIGDVGFLIRPLGACAPFCGSVRFTCPC
jgi:hypothetical protein